MAMAHMKETALRFLANFSNDIAFGSDKTRQQNSIQKRFTRFSRERFYICIIYNIISKKKKQKN